MVFLLLYYLRAEISLALFREVAFHSVHHPPASNFIAVFHKVVYQLLLTSTKRFILAAEKTTGASAAELKLKPAKNTGRLIIAGSMRELQKMIGPPTDRSFFAAKTPFLHTDRGMMSRF